MKQSIFSMQNAARVIKALLASYVVTSIMLLLLAGLLYKFRLDDGKIQIGIIFTYIISCITGGFLVGKIMRSRQFLWGLFLGILYFMIMLAVSVAVNHEVQSMSGSMITSFLLCVGGGLLGGMLS